ncbi:hypothetical protein evm_006359 [Chilo suppressalis]|nr:hypothetical protein evm_006359 [Chilo suppressalis]
MVAGFITVRRRNLTLKPLHAIFTRVGLPLHSSIRCCLAVFDYHNTVGDQQLSRCTAGIGPASAMGLFGLQYAVGFFSFLLLLICNKGTASFRASLVPIHAAFGILTFVLGAAACLTGLTEKALFDIGKETYATMSQESIVMNAIGMSVVAVAVVVLYTVRGTGGYRLRKVAQNPS